MSNGTRNSIEDWKRFLYSKSLCETMDSESAFHSAMRRLDNLIASRVPSTKGMIWRNGKINPNANIQDVNAALCLISKFGQADLDALGDPSDPNRLSGTPINNLFISQEDSKLDEWTPSNNQNQGRADNFVPNKSISFGKKQDGEVSKNQTKTMNINDRMKILTKILEK